MTEKDKAAIGPYGVELAEALGARTAPQKLPLVQQYILDLLHQGVRITQERRRRDGQEPHYFRHDTNRSVNGRAMQRLLQAGLVLVYNNVRPCPYRPVRLTPAGAARFETPAQRPPRTLGTHALILLQSIRRGRRISVIRFADGRLRIVGAHVGGGLTALLHRGYVELGPENAFSEQLLQLTPAGKAYR
jgi:hypothetical protein